MSATQPGTVSHGTLRAEDLIPAFIAALPDDGNTAALRAEAAQFTAADYESGIAVDFLHEVLFDALDAHAPDGCYFGAHPGDGSDFGYWPVEDDETE